MDKSLKDALKKVDPNLKIVSKHRTSKKDWEKAKGIECSSCGSETLKTYGPFKQCFKCFYREKGVFLNETECPKCKASAAKVTALADGLQIEKIICPECGTYYP